MCVAYSGLCKWVPLYGQCRLPSPLMFNRYTRFGWRNSWAMVCGRVVYPNTSVQLKCLFLLSYWLTIIFGCMFPHPPTNVTIDKIFQATVRMVSSLIDSETPWHSVEVEKKNILANDLMTSIEAAAFLFVGGPSTRVPRNPRNYYYSYCLSVLYIEHISD